MFVIAIKQSDNIGKEISLVNGKLIMLHSYLHLA